MVWVVKCKIIIIANGDLSQFLVLCGEQDIVTIQVQVKSLSLVIILCQALTSHNND